MVVGNFKNSIRFFDTILEGSPESNAWFRREVAFHYLQNIDNDVLSYNIDTEVHPGIKEGHSITATDPREFMREFPDYESAVTKYHDCLDNENGASEIPSQSQELLLLTAELARWIQLDCPGFMANKRHQRMFGIAVLQAAQTLRAHISLLRKGGRGLEIPNSCSSRTSLDNVVTDNKNHHIFGWRDLFDIMIRWRQVSAFGDAVWWTDLFTTKNAADRHGITTWILDGGTNVRP